MELKKVVWGCVALVLVLAGQVSAQTAAATITGRVSDATGLSLPGAAVTVQGVDLSRTFVTESDGRYRFLDLPPGTYTLTSVLDGFATLVRKNVVVDLGR